MTAWNSSFSLSQSSELSTLISSASSFASSLNSTLDTISTGLNFLSSTLTSNVNTLSALAESSIELFDNYINDFFSIGGYQVIAHPYMPGVGDGEGVYKNLSFPRAVDVISKSFFDYGDANRPSFSSVADVEMLCIFLTAPSLSAFSSLAESFNALIGFKELSLVIRRIKQFKRLEKERYVKKKASIPPDWNSFKIRDFKVFSELENNLKNFSEMLRGYYEAGESSVDLLLKIMSNKQKQVEEFNNSLTLVVNALSGVLESGVYSFYTSGNGGNQFLKNELINSTNQPSYDMPYTFALALVSPTIGALSKIKDFFSL